MGDRTSQSYGSDCLFATVTVTTAAATLAAAVAAVSVTVPTGRLVAGVEVMPLLDCYVAASSDTAGTHKQPVYAGVWNSLPFKTALANFGLLGAETTAYVRVHLV